MVRVLIVKSTRTEIPLAEVRTDGRIVHFIVDNTEGSLPDQTQGSLEKLMKLVHNSSHLIIEEPKKATVGIYRYMLDTGDVIEMTTDGKTAILNGKLLNEQEKAAIFNAVKNKEINVKNKTNIETPIPIFGTQKVKKQPEKSKQELKFNPLILQHIKENIDKTEKIRKNASKEYDEELEQIAKTDLENPDGFRKLLYALKYGD
jgi:hypothetical protein